MNSPIQLQYLVFTLIFNVSARIRVSSTLFQNLSAMLQKNCNLKLLNSSMTNFSVAVSNISVI
jgi:hypothetical protein